MKTFFVVHNSWISPATLIEILKSIGIKDILEAWNGLVLFKGTETSTYYADRIHEKNTLAHLVVTEYEFGKTYGWLSSEIWDWVKKP